MMRMNGFSKLEDLAGRPYFRTDEANERGVSSSLLCYYVKKGLVERVEQGLYRIADAPLDIDFRWEDLFYAYKSVSNSVVCLISALSLYDLTDEMARTHWVAIPHADRAPKRDGIRVVRMRNIELGQTQIVLGKEKIKIFDRERTIVDSFRYLSFEIAMKALKRALQEGGDKKIDVNKLSDYAKKLRVNIKPYLMAVLV